MLSWLEEGVTVAPAEQAKSGTDAQRSIAVFDGAVKHSDDDIEKKHTLTHIQ